MKDSCSAAEISLSCSSGYGLTKEKQGHQGCLSQVTARKGTNRGNRMAERSSCGRVLMDPCPMEPRAGLSCAIGLEGLSKAEGCTSTYCFSFITDGEEGGRKKPNQTHLVNRGRIFSLHVLSFVQNGIITLKRQENLLHSVHPM